MQFDKPKVTIDLEEYQYLKDRVNGMETDEYVIAAKQVIAALLTNKGDIRASMDALSAVGIIFSLDYSSRYATYLNGLVVPDQISISLIDKTK